MGEREELEAAFAEAEAALAKAVNDRDKADVDAVEANAHLEKARAHCRHARAALAESNRERSTRSSEPRVADAEKPSRERPGSQKAIQGLTGGFPARGPDAPGWRLLARQSLMLLALVLAYLQYYFLDVQLQVTRLPSITTILTRLGS